MFTFCILIGGQFRRPANSGSRTAEFGQPQTWRLPYLYVQTEKTMPFLDGGAEAVNLCLFVLTESAFACLFQLDAWRAMSMLGG